MRVLKNCNKRNGTYGSGGPQVSTNVNDVYVLSRVYESQKGVQK